MKLKIDFLKQGLLLVLCLFAFSNFALAQRTVTGTISDAESGEALIGATVVVVGTTTGTITDFEGKYSLKVPDGSTQLEISYTGYPSKTVDLGASNVMDISLTAGAVLDEIVVTGYGTQKEKEITSSVVEITEKDFNQGVISDPAQLLQGKVAGLQVYNRGGDPNGETVIRLRGISTVGANVQPLVVIDGVIGASLENVDPYDIESISVLKDGSAAAIYGSRGSSGVLIVTTKKAKPGDGVKIEYNGQLEGSAALSSVDIMSAQEFLAAGGTDLGSQTDWIDEVTRTGFSHNHGLAVSAAVDNTAFRVSANLRNTEGILKNSGFKQFNTRLSASTAAFSDKLRINFTASYTDRDLDRGFDEALRYAVLYNPTAPVFGVDSPFPFNSEQYGGYFETLGLFDSFNPVSLIEQNKNEGKRRTFNYNAAFAYDIIESLSVNLNVAQQQGDFSNRIYYPTTSLFNGNASSPTRKGLARFFEADGVFNLYEAYANYLVNFNNGDLKLTGGYSYQELKISGRNFTIGDFPDDSKDFSNILQSSQDLQNAGFIEANSFATPEEKIIAFFGRANFTFDDAIFFNASIRREGSTKLGENNKWGWFPAFGLGTDLNKYFGISGVNLFKLRIGFGITGALPENSGLSKEGREIVNDGNTGAVSTQLVRAANPDLKWEQKAETNVGIEFGMDRLNATLDLYNRDISDFILERNVDAAVFGVDRRFENAGKLNTKGLELAVDYDVVRNSNFKYNAGIVLSTYKTELKEYILDAETRANLGAPGQNGTNMILVKVGDEIGNIWGPVFTGVDNGNPVFADVNGDGELITGQDRALDPEVDFEVLGNGVPDLELGWTNELIIGNWTVNAFFRGAFGHSLVNTFRAFYEPQLSTQSSYNFVNTELAVDGLTTARFSSLYVEKADFFKLDNFTVSRKFDIHNDNLHSFEVSLTIRNPFVITSYTGTDPEPNFVDTGAEDNGFIAEPETYDVLSPGIERRNNYFNSRSVALGLNIIF